MNRKRGDILHGRVEGLEVWSDKPGACSPVWANFKFQPVIIVLRTRVTNIPCGKVENVGIFRGLFNMAIRKPIQRCLHSGWVCEVYGSEKLYLIPDNYIQDMELIGYEFLQCEFNSFGNTQMD